ncbi:MAG: alanine racemase [Clostridia bacterium]|nr:alanine racemase [Clostridia bacterium]
MQKTLSVINLAAIRRNAQRIKKLIGGAKLFAVVKADAYGHGAEEVSRYIEDVADGFCVAIIEEGIALRIAGISKPVLVLTPPLDGYDVARAKAYGLTVTVNSVETAKLAKGATCHIKVNTGMNRSGCNLNDLGAVLNALNKESVQGVYSHLFAAESRDAAARQKELFKRAVNAVKAVNPEAVAHLSASGGTLRGREYLFDGVRCGLLLYGYAPTGFKANGFERTLKVYARRTQTTQFIGGGVGYNFADKSYKTLATYRLGYADGFSRVVPLGEKTLCMDAFVGVDKGELLCVMDDAESYAQKCGTISYEVLTSVTRRSERIYER